VVFDVAADSYDRFMGRYSVHLSAQMADLAGVAAGQRVLDVGCGPGALTEELVRRVGADAVSAADPSAPFVEAVRQRLPGVHVRQAFAEDLPFEDGQFDAVLAQLVVQFMANPVEGLREMRRVAREGGVVVACMWDHPGGRGPLTPYWEAVHRVAPGIPGEEAKPGAFQGDMARLFREAGFDELLDTELSVSVEHETFEEWWEPFTLGVGPAGSALKKVDAQMREAVREEARRGFPPAPFTITAYAWTVRAVKTSS
jgi:ubiquinone/menaquinone biosynthesis C-methylase UbiE